MKLTLSIGTALIAFASLEAAAAVQKILPPATGSYHATYINHSTEFDTPDTVMAKIQDYEKQFGKKLNMFFMDDHWFLNLGQEPGEIPLPAEHIKRLYKEGVYVVLRSMPASSEKALEDHTQINDFSLDNIVSGSLDNQIRNYVRGIKDLGVPIMFAFAPEMNGDWFHWSGIHNGGATKTSFGDPDLADGPEKYKVAYKKIIAMAREEGVQNVTWVEAFEGHPSDELAPLAWNDYSAYYLGDDYIDWIGFSVYGPQNSDSAKYWFTFDDVIFKKYGPRARNLDDMRAISKCRPFGIFEMGVTHSPTLPTAKQEWITAAFKSVTSKKLYRTDLPNTPTFQLVSYWILNSWLPDNNASKPETPGEIAAYTAGVKPMVNNIVVGEKVNLCH